MIVLQNRFLFCDDFMKEKKQSFEKKWWKVLFFFFKFALHFSHFCTLYYSSAAMPPEFWVLSVLGYRTRTNRIQTVPKKSKIMRNKNYGDCNCEVNVVSFGFLLRRALVFKYCENKILLGSNLKVTANYNT